MGMELHFELRLALFMTALVCAFYAGVSAFAYAHGYQNAVTLGALNPVMLLVWGSTFGFLLLAYLVNVTLLRKKEQPLHRIVASDLKGLFRAERVVARATILFSWFFTMLIFSPFKVMIGKVTHFPLDHTIANFERSLLGGHDAWTYTHAIFGHPIATFVIQTGYTAWFMLMWLSVIYCIVQSDNKVFRARYMISFALCWIVIGAIAAYFLASAGPCYYERVFGDPHFHPLMARLNSIDAYLHNISPNLGIASLAEQNWLWDAMKDGDNIFGGGISAMPSLHVGLATLMACAAFELDKRSGWIMTGFALWIWVGSVHLGWHYASDGVVSSLMAFSLWKLSAKIVAVLMTAPKLSSPASVASAT